ncbi:MAG TPA: extracellular solute-binding protein [Planctomycetota bacterium]|nr:extracellular solute-binding protein [Planctomycetota bacterium]
MRESAGRREFLLWSAAGAAAGLLGCSRKESGPEPLRVLTHPGQILPIFTHHLDYLRSAHGIALRLLEAPDATSYQQALKDARTGGGQYDLVMYYPRYNGELALSYLRPLDDLIGRFGAGPLFDNIVDTYRILYTRWGGRTIAVPVDGDVAMLYYRKDAFESEEARRRFREKHGQELRVPRTWEEFRRAAEFFTGWVWGPTGRPGYGFQTSTWARDYAEQQWAPMMASAGGNWFTRDLRPGWNNAAGARALRDLRELLAFTPPGSLSLSWDQTMETVFAHDVALVLWYMDLGRLGGTPGSWFARSGGPEKMKNFGYAPWPGYETDGVYRNFNSMFYGRVVGLSRFSKRPEEAFQVLRTLLLPERRVLSMDDAQSGSDMFLKTDYDPAAFRRLSVAPEFLRTARRVLENGFPEMQLPGAGEYLDALQGEIHGYLTGHTASPEAALAAAADRWEAITERWGRDRQKNYWLEILDRYRQAGLRLAGL